jgi:hypothetical protein
MKAAGLESPDISILSDDFLAEVRTTTPIDMRPTTRVDVLAALGWSEDTPLPHPPVIYGGERGLAGVGFSEFGYPASATSTTTSASMSWRPVQRARPSSWSHIDFAVERLLGWSEDTPLPHPPVIYGGEN